MGSEMCIRDSSVTGVKAPDKVKNVSKGVAETTKKNLTSEEYFQCLSTGVDIRRNVTSIKSKKHKLKTIRERRVALGSFDIKRKILPCGLHRYS